MRRAAALAALLLAPCLALAPRLALAQGEAGPDARYTVGAGGWSSERFGEGVAILRAGLASASGVGFLLLSCEGGEHRLRLSLPAPIALPRPEAVRGGTVLVRGLGGTAPGRIVAQVALADGRVLGRAETAGRPGGAVTALARLLRARPARLDLLFRPDGAPRLPARAVPVVLAMVWRAGDTLAVDDFLAACAR